MTAARQEMTARWDTVYLDLCIGHYGFALDGLSLASLPSTSTWPLSQRKTNSEDDFGESQDDEDYAHSQHSLSTYDEYKPVWTQGYERKMSISPFSTHTLDSEASLTAL